MATFTAQYWTEDDTPQTLEFQADKNLRDDNEALEEIARREMAKRYGYRSANAAEFTDFFLELNRDAILNQIIETVKKLDRYEDYFAVDMDGDIAFYESEQAYKNGDEAIEWFDANVATEEAIDKMGQNCTEEAEIRYDGLKFFTVEAIY